MWSCNESESHTAKMSQQVPFKPQLNTNLNKPLEVKESPVIDRPRCHLFHVALVGALAVIQGWEKCDQTYWLLPCEPLNQSIPLLLSPVTGYIRQWTVSSYFPFFGFFHLNDYNRPERVNPFTILQENCKSKREIKDLLLHYGTITFWWREDWYHSHISPLIMKLSLA